MGEPADEPGVGIGDPACDGFGDGNGEPPCEGLGDGIGEPLWLCDGLGDGNGEPLCDGFGDGKGDGEPPWLGEGMPADPPLGCGGGFVHATAPTTNARPKSNRTALLSMLHLIRFSLFCARLGSHYSRRARP
jgi:hypothetical protein